ncbi:MAG: sigma-54-dependent Fis family transcriptional regulator [Rhizobiales bacterium]|nr:sigma-54-dependent Fis family transcriptional regulator [Hyphomicrobiales bacterium]
MASDILIVDDEADIRELVAGILEDEGYEVRTAHDSDSALSVINDRRPRLIFLDIWLQGSKLDGLALLDVIKEQHPELAVVVISGHGNIETAVSAIRRGAYDYIEKPFKADRLVLIAERALENAKLKKQIEELVEKSVDSSELIGESTAIVQLRSTIEKVAPTNSRIMIIGATGSGKELVARSVHEHSQRSSGPFVTLSASTLSEDMMDVALFGSEEDTKWGRRVGALEEAHGGTLYLDEVSDMPKQTQEKMLRVLVQQDFCRVGGANKVKINVRILSSTTRNLEEEISKGNFREDLFHRLAVVPMKVPSLSERREDIPLLVEHFIQQISASAGIQPKKLEPDAFAVLQAHPWPGNTRQLRNNLERLLILTQDDENATLSADLLPKEIGEMLPSATGSGKEGEHLMSLPLREAREMFEREYLTAQIARFGGNISKTSEFVGMERSALHRKLKSLGVH